MKKVNNKESKSLNIIKVAIVIFIIVAIIIGIYILKNVINKKSVNTNDLSAEIFTEEEAVNFSTQKLSKYLKTFKEDYYIRYIINKYDESGLVSTRDEEFSEKNSPKLSAAYSNLTNLRVVIDHENELVYVVDEKNAVINKYKKDDNTNYLKMNILFYNLSDIEEEFTDFGRETLNEVDYYYEEYKMPTDNEKLIRYYFDNEDNIKFIKVYEKEKKEYEIYEIKMLENKNYSYIFNLDSEEYTIYDNTNIVSTNIE